MSDLQNFSLSSWKFEFAPQIQYYADSKKFFGINGAAGMLPFESRNPREGIECDRKVKSSGLLISRREAFGSRTVLEGNSIVEFPRGNSLSREWRGKVESGGRRRVGEGWEVGGERGSRISSVKNREDYSFWIALSIDGYRSMDTGDKNSGKFIRNEIYPGERDICLDWTKPGQS